MPSLLISLGHLLQRLAKIFSGEYARVSIEVEPWRSEGISAKYFVVMFLLGTMFDLLGGNFITGRRACLMEAVPLCFAPEGFHLDRVAP